MTHLVFSSILFLFFYLPIVLLLYYITPKTYRNLLLFLVNLVFYAWGEPIYILIMFASILIDYTHGILIEKNRKQDKKARLLVLSSVLCNLGLLVFFKYYDFIIANLNMIPGFAAFGLQPLGLPLPLGISFYTFQTMSYTIDVYRNDTPAQKNIITFGTFVTLFPQLIAGPIIKYKDVAAQLENRKENVQQFASGIQLFVIGLGKKVLFANQIGLLWDAMKAAPDLTIIGAWLGAIACGLQLYFDFSGYSDMAIGLGRMFGFDFKKNFYYPFCSSNISEFWRRWHISLGTWFREYVYIPLGGNRVKLPLQYRNILVVWALTGIWHGASWNFLCWGLYFAFFLILEKTFLLKLLQKMPAWIGHVYTLLALTFSWILFSIENFTAIGAYFGAMLGLGGQALVNAHCLYYLRNFGPLLLVLLLACTPFAANQVKKLAPRMLGILSPVFVLLVLFVCTAYLVNSGYNPFLYFRF